MSEEPPAIPLADVLRAANDLVAAGLIEDYALGGALAADLLRRTVYDLRRRYHFRRGRERTDRWHPCDLRAPCRSAAGESSASIYSFTDSRFNSSPPPGSRKKRSAKRARSNTKECRRKCSRPEHIIAIAASVGRHKDLARIEQLLEQTEIDRTLLDDILRRYNLQLPAAMKTAIRRHLARLPFEEKIRKVGQLIKLSAKVKSSRVREGPPMKQRAYGSAPSTEETSIDSKL